MRAMYRSMGMDRRACAKFLHVSERTLHNWESGHHAVPYAAYKLLRIHCKHELPGKAWRGWLFHSGKLWTPEGHGLNPGDACHWANLSRRAQMLGEMYQENVKLRERLRRAESAEGVSLAGKAPHDRPGEVPYTGTHVQNVLPAIHYGASTPTAFWMPPPLGSTGRTKDYDVNLTSYRHQSDVKTAIPTPKPSGHYPVECSQIDIRITSWPSVYDYPTNSINAQEIAPKLSGFLLTRSFALRWMPSCVAGYPHSHQGQFIPLPLLPVGKLSRKSHNSNRPQNNAPQYQTTPSPYYLQSPQRPNVANWPSGTGATLPTSNQAFLWRSDGSVLRPFPGKGGA